MEKITIKPIFHRGGEQAAIVFKPNASIQQALKTVPGIRWTRTFRCWYVPLTKEDCRNVYEAVKSYGSIDTTDLSAYLKKRSVVTIASHLSSVEKWQGKLLSRNIAGVNQHVLPSMTEKLKLKAYSSSTIRTYVNEMGQLLQALGNIAADELQPQHLKRYLIYCYEKLGLKENTLHSRINAMKFYYEQVLGKDKFFWEIPRPKKPLRLPRLLNENELARLFNALPNRKHKAMLFTTYSAGLRVSEVVNLKISDIDSKRMQILVRQAKGKKDRYVSLSPVLLDILRQYITGCRPTPREYLFESRQTCTAYPTRTVQQIFSNAKRKAGIRKEVGVHSLRHSFATHLLDKGTDIRYIKELLGHFNIKTTERYLHVSKGRLVNISSPFDDLWEKQVITW